MRSLRLFATIIRWRGCESKDAGSMSVMPRCWPGWKMNEVMERVALRPGRPRTGGILYQSPLILFRRQGARRPGRHHEFHRVVLLVTKKAIRFGRILQ